MLLLASVGAASFGVLTLAEPFQYLQPGAFRQGRFHVIGSLATMALALPCNKAAPPPLQGPLTQSPMWCKGLHRCMGGGTLNDISGGCRVLDGMLGSWYMRSYSINLLFGVVVLTTLKVRLLTPPLTLRRMQQDPEREQRCLLGESLCVGGLENLRSAACPGRQSSVCCI